MCAHEGLETCWLNAMDLKQKNTKELKLAPIGVKKSKDRNRLKGGCTGLMYACQQGLSDSIIKEVRSQVNIKKHQGLCMHRHINRQSV